MRSIVLHCRAGFEKECAAEIEYHAESLGAPGHAAAEPNTARVVFTPLERSGERTLEKLRLTDLVFARQLVFGCTEVTDLPPGDRLTGVRAAVPGGVVYQSVVVEPCDTNEAKSLSSFCRKFSPYLERALTATGQLDPNRTHAPRLNVVFTDAAHAWVGHLDEDNSSAWPMGIPRLGMPRDAPSRSTLKLFEAWLTLMTETERDTLLRGGMRAVDLGAAPGGWTWQLVQKGMLVTAVDNGPMDPTLMASGMVDHVRADGFDFRPRKPADWLVCDMVEKPSRIAKLAADWLTEKRATRAIVNFKLPMKKRFEEWLRLCEIIDTAGHRAGLDIRLRAKQLYHDREEITAYLFVAGPQRKSR